MGKRRPEKWQLYQWNPVDGLLGLPKRKIKIEKREPCLLHAAYLGGGPDWEEGETPKNSVLRLVLNASPFSQSEQNYYNFFDKFKDEDLSLKFGVKVDRLAGQDRACWQIERCCRGMNDAEIDRLIESILVWHEEEVKRIINDRPSFSF
ncbi:MAG: hypothetical protein HQM13_08700 [SAR324 cluster bacterium]|nr:hypothetical protein [SAR324 cluster bacterium]